MDRGVDRRLLSRRAFLLTTAGAAAGLLAACGEPVPQPGLPTVVPSPLPKPVEAIPTVAPTLAPTVPTAPIVAPATVPTPFVPRVPQSLTFTQENNIYQATRELKRGKRGDLFDEANEQKHRRDSLQNIVDRAAIYRQRQNNDIKMDGPMVIELSGKQYRLEDPTEAVLVSALLDIKLSGRFLFENLSLIEGLQGNIHFQSFHGMVFTDADALIQFARVRQTLAQLGKNVPNRYSLSAADPQMDYPGGPVFDYEHPVASMGFGFTRSEPQLYQEFAHAFQRVQSQRDPTHPFPRLVAPNLYLSNSNPEGFASAFEAFYTRGLNYRDRIRYLRDVPLNDVADLFQGPYDVFHDWSGVHILGEGVIADLTPLKPGDIAKVRDYPPYGVFMKENPVPVIDHKIDRQLPSGDIVQVTGEPVTIEYPNGFGRKDGELSTVYPATHMWVSADGSLNPGFIGYFPTDYLSATDYQQKPLN